MTGGTLSGSLYIEGTNAFNTFLKASSIEQGVNPTDSVATPGIHFHDKNDNLLGYIDVAQRTDGRQDLRLWVINKNSNDEEVPNTLQIQISPDGTCGYYVTDPAAFRTAINAVNKNGDTVLNQLSVYAATPNYILRSTQVDASLANNGVSTTIWPALIWQDKESRTTCRFEEIVYANGAIGSYWYLRNYNTSGDLAGQKGMSMTLQKNGTITYGVDDPSAFRKAIQVDSFWTVAKISVTVGKAPNSNTNITAPTVSGYSFWSWYYFATNGWVGAVYCSGILVANTSVWVVGNSAGATSGTGTVDCYALYKRN